VGPAYQIPIALIRKELDCEPTGITSSVRRALLSANSREADENRRLLADLAEQVGTAQVGNVFRDLEHAVCASTLGVDDPAEKQSATGHRNAMRETYRSGIRSRSKCASRSIKWKSCKRSGPDVPTR
jgi:hypothetical protein